MAPARDLTSASATFAIASWSFCSSLLLYDWSEAVPDWGDNPAEPSGQGRKSVSDRLVPVFGGVLVAQGGPRTGVPTPSHQLSHARTSSGRPGKAGMAEVVKVKVGAPDRLPGVVPDPLEIAGRDRGTSGRPKQPALGAGSDEVLQMVRESGDDVLGHVEDATTGLALRRAHHWPSTGRDDPGLLNPDGAVDEVEMPALKRQYFTSTELAPSREEEGGTVALGRRLNKTSDFSDGSHWSLRGR